MKPLSSAISPETNSEAAAAALPPLSAWGGRTENGADTDVTAPSTSSASTLTVRLAHVGSASLAHAEQCVANGIAHDVVGAQRKKKKQKRACGQ